MNTGWLMRRLVCWCALCTLAVTALGQTPGAAPTNYALIRSGAEMEEIIRIAARVVPSPRQWAWQEREFVAFFHFGTNTFTDREWGLGNENPSVVNPTDFDARQWVRTIRDAGMKLAIITAKHHDGLCLWPSKYTEHSIRNSPWRSGKGDVVRDVAAACREYGLKFGVYLSPWDRHEPSYGDSPRYNEHFRNQLRELLTNYGEVSEVWFDGACGEGPNGKRQVYDWKSYYALIRELQPQAVIAIMGPDVRWVGTESGYGRETEWSVVPDVVGDLDSIAAGSQKNPVDGAFIPGDLTSADIGSREKIRGAHALAWYPAETDVSIRPGWFYHADQDLRVKTPEKLVDIYYSSVGRNSVLLLNIPPDKRGRIHDNDIKNLRGMKQILDQTFATNLASSARVTASSASAGHGAAFSSDADPATYWTTAEGASSAALEWVFADERVFDRAVLQEYIRAGQRIERFHLEAWNGTRWDTIAQGTTVGYKRLLRFPAVTATKVRLVIEQSRTSPTLAMFGLFKAPPRPIVMPEGRAFRDTIVVSLSTDVPGIPIRYTLDGTVPTQASPRYTGPIVLRESATVTALAVMNGELCLEATEARFSRGMEVRNVSLESPPSPKYQGHGATTLIDGRRAGVDFQAGDWLGFEGSDLMVTLDLGDRQQVTAVTAGFLQQQGSWIFLPSVVTMSLSLDGKSWSTPMQVSYPLEKTEDVLVKDCTFQLGSVAARYVRIGARNIGGCPPWHSGAGDKAWLFVDEVMVK